jgi:hypothetical protein
MGLAARLVHRLAIVTPTSAGEDADGQPVPGAPRVELVNGLVEPKTARELVALSQAGSQVSTHTVLLMPRTIGAGAWIRDEPDAGRRFDITGIRTFDAGRDQHIELDASLVGAPVEVPA